MRPASGRSNPAISRSVVVLPDPEGPSSVKNSPGAMSRSTQSTATTSPYALRTPARRTSGVVCAVCGAAGVSGSACVAKRFLQQLEPVLELLVGDRERNEDADHVTVDAAGEQDEAARAGGSGYCRRDIPRRLRQPEREHRPHAAHLTPHVATRPKSLE